VRRLVLSVCCVAWLCAHVAAETIKEIVIEDNKKTTSETVELIAGVSVDDEWKPELVDLVKSRLVSSGLFREVEVFWDPVAGGGVRLHILVKDKHSWVVAPTFYNQPTNTGGGVGFGENNLFGLNQKLLLYAQVATGDSFFIGAWVIPSIGGTRLYAGLDTWLKSSRNIEYAPPSKYLDNPKAVRESRIHYLNAGVKLGVELFRGIKLDSRLRGAKVSYRDVRVCSRDVGVPAADEGCVHGDSAMIGDVTGDPASDPTNVPKPGKEGWDVSNEWTFSIDRRANWYGVQTGHRYQLSYEYGITQLGSDFHYNRFGASVYEAMQVLERHNLVFKGNLNIGHHLPFQQELLTGGTSMRGWLNNQFRGDFQLLANLEYSLPVFEIGGFGVRGLGFFDSAYTTFTTTSNPERNYLPGSQFEGGRFFAGFKNSIGVGTRLYLRQVVLPLLGLDLGYGLEARDVQVYLAIGITD
jgi:outer membrane protein insertion porin family